MICSLDLSQDTKKLSKRKFVLSGSSNGPLYIWTQTTFGEEMGAGARENRGRCAAVVREAKDERAGGERSKKAGSRRNYAILDISQSKKG